MRNLGKVGFVFNGGGLAGIYSIGFVKALAAKGIKPDYVQGISVGALTSAKLIATNWDVEGIEKDWLKIQELGPSAIFNNWEIPKNAALLRPSLYNDYRILKLIIKNIDLKAVVDSPIKYHIIANNSNKNQPTAFSNHDELIKKEPERLEKILLAAIGLYGFLPAIMIDGDWYNDGMSSQLNEAIKARCDTIFIFFNSQFGPNQINFGELPFYLQFLYGFHNTNIQLDEKEIKYARSRGYDIIENNPSGRFDDTDSFHKKFRRRIKHLVNGAIEAAKADGDLEDAFSPHRLIILTPPNPIPTITALRFKQPNPKIGYPGDLTLAIEQCSKIPDEFLEKI